MAALLLNSTTAANCPGRSVATTGGSHASPGRVAIFCSDCWRLTHALGRPRVVSGTDTEILKQCANSEGEKVTIAHALSISSGGPPSIFVAEEETFVFGETGEIEARSFIQ